MSFLINRHTFPESDRWVGAAGLCLSVCLPACHLALGCQSAFREPGSGGAELEAEAGVQVGHRQGLPIGHQAPEKESE